MESDTLKQQIRDTYTKEYERAMPLSLPERLMAYPAAILLGGSAWAIAGGALAMAAGFAAAPLWIIGGLAAAAGGVGLGLGTLLFGKKRARDAVERGIEDGSLVTRYQTEVSGKTPAPAAGPSPLSDATAKAAFNAPAAAEQTQSAAPVTPKAPAPQAPVQP